VYIAAGKISRSDDYGFAVNYYKFVVHQIIYAFTAASGIANYRNSRIFDNYQSIVLLGFPRGSHSTVFIGIGKLYNVMIALPSVISPTPAVKSPGRRRHMFEQ